MASTADPSVELGPLGLENPMGTDGFEFVEYTAPDIELLRDLFGKMGFPEVARHKSKNVTLHRQGLPAVRAFLDAARAHFGAALRPLSTQS